MIGPSLLSMMPISSRLPAWSESVDHVVVADAVLACADGDQRSIPPRTRLACSSLDRKSPCDWPCPVSELSANDLLTYSGQMAFRDRPDRTQNSADQDLYAHKMVSKGDLNTCFAGSGLCRSMVNNPPEQGFRAFSDPLRLV